MEIAKSARRESLPAIVAERARSIGAAGEAWLAELDETIAVLERAWGITVGSAMPGGHTAMPPAQRERNGVPAS